MGSFIKSRSGGVLLLVLAVMAIVLSVVLLAAATFHGRATLARDSLSREEARDTLLTAVSNAVDLLLSDTNGVDHLAEKWADSDAFFPTVSPYRGELEDESARISLATADAALLEAVLTRTDIDLDGGTPGERKRYAETIVASRDAWMAEHDGAPPPSFAFYAEWGAMFPNWVTRMREFATPCRTAAVNVNTAPQDVLRAVLMAAGAEADAADAMAWRAIQARSGGVTVGTVTRQTLSTLFLGEGTLPTEQEGNMLARAERMLGASSTLFRGWFRCARPAVSVRFVYDREARAFRAWSE